MPASPDLIERSAELKRALVAYAQGEAFSGELQRFLEERFGGEPPDEDHRTNAIDAFLLQHRLADGRTPLEHYLDGEPSLSASERELLLRWHDVVEGVFVVQRRDRDTLLVENLVDELMYRVRSHTGPGAFSRVKEGAFLVARLVPIEDEWLISGASTLFTRSQQEIAYRIAAELAEAHPRLVFRNPTNVARAWEQQRREREAFIAFFGADLVVLAGPELEDRMRAFARYQVYEARDEEGKTVAERARRVYGTVPPLPDPELPPELRARETVGVVYDEIDGMQFLPDFALVERGFAEPFLAAEGPCREAIQRYLDDPTISPRVIERLAVRDTGRASRVLAQLLDAPDFTWEQDGEATLRRLKAGYYEKPIRPSVVPLSEELARAKLGMGSSFMAGVARRVGRSGRRQRRR